MSIELPGHASCRSCGAAIVWAITDVGKLMPVDYEPAEGGTVHLWRNDTDQLRATVVGSTLFDTATDEPLRVSHFATCPNAPQHRKAKT